MSKWRLVKLRLKSHLHDIQEAAIEDDTEVDNSNTLSSSQTDEDSEDLISKLSKSRVPGVEFAGESLQSELREDDSDESEDISGFTGGSGSEATPTDTPTDEDRDKKVKKKSKPINAELREKIRKELTGPGQFADPAARANLRSARYSIAVSSGTRRQQVELGSSVHSTVARNLPDIFSSGEKKPDEMLELLRERRRSRATLTKAHIIVEQLGTDKLKCGVPEVEITELEPQQQQQQQVPILRPSSVSPQKTKLEISLESESHSKSLPQINMADLLDSDDENDIISKMVGHGGMLAAPYSGKSRKISLQEELTGSKTPAGVRPMRTSVAGEIAQSVSPNLPGLVIPDKWKTDFVSRAAESTTEISSTTSSSCELSESDQDYRDTVSLEIEPRSSLERRTSQNELLKRLPLPVQAEPIVEQTEAGKLCRSSSTAAENEKQKLQKEEGKEESVLPNPTLLGYDLPEHKVGTESSEKDESDYDGGDRHRVRVKRRKSSSERRRSQPELDFCAEDDSDEDVDLAGGTGVVLCYHMEGLTSTKKSPPAGQAVSADSQVIKDNQVTGNDTENPDVDGGNEESCSLVGSIEPVVLNIGEAGSENKTVSNNVKIEKEVKVEERKTCLAGETENNSVNLEDDIRLRKDNTDMEEMEEPMLVELPDSGGLLPGDKSIGVHRSSDEEDELLSKSQVEFDLLENDAHDIAAENEALLENEADDIAADNEALLENDADDIAADNEALLKNEADKKVADNKDPLSTYLEQINVSDPSFEIDTTTDRRTSTPVDSVIDNIINSDLQQSSTQLEIVVVGSDGRISKQPSLPFRYRETVSPRNKEESEANLKAQIHAMQEELGKSDLIIAELNITIEDLKEYNTKLENDIKSREAIKSDSNLESTNSLGLNQSDEWLNLELEVARLQKEVTDRDAIIRTQKEALDKTLSKGSCASPRQVSLAGAVKQALDVNVGEMARLYNETLRLCRRISSDTRDGFMDNTDREFYEKKLEELDKKHYELIEELGLRHAEEVNTLRSDYEVLLELAVKEKEEEMRNTIIENGELEELAEQVESLNDELRKKEKQIEFQENTISYLKEDLQNLERKASQSSGPPTPPTIIIEDPDGKQQCDECTAKASQVDNLNIQIKQMELRNGKEITLLKKKNEDLSSMAVVLEKELDAARQSRDFVSRDGADISSQNSDSSELQLELEHSRMERDEAQSMAVAEIKSFYNKIYERFHSVSGTFADLRESRSVMRNDIHRLRCDMDAMAQQVVTVLREYQVAQEKAVSSSAVQTDQPLDSSLSTNSGTTAQSSANQNSDANHEAQFRSRESGYKKEIFELKVKLKELEAKVVHLRKQQKAKEIEPRSEYIIDGPNKEEKLIEMLRYKDDELRQARRLHGQNLATMRKKHDKTVEKLQGQVERLELTLRQLLPADEAGDDNRRRTRSMVLPVTPSSLQNDNFIIMQQTFGGLSNKDLSAILKYR